MLSELVIRDFAITLGNYQSVGSWGTLGYLLMSAANLREVIHILATHGSILASPLEISLSRETDETFEIRLRLDLASHPTVAKGWIANIALTTHIGHKLAKELVPVTLNAIRDLW